MVVVMLLLWQFHGFGNVEATAVFLIVVFLSLQVVLIGFLCFLKLGIEQLVGLFLRLFVYLFQ